MMSVSTILLVLALLLVVLGLGPNDRYPTWYATETRLAVPLLLTIIAGLVRGG